jgi:hypothetical protein
MVVGIIEFGFRALIIISFLGGTTFASSLEELHGLLEKRERIISDVLTQEDSAENMFMAATRFLALSQEYIPILERTTLSPSQYKLASSGYRTTREAAADFLFLAGVHYQTSGNFGKAAEIYQSIEDKFREPELALHRERARRQLDTMKAGSYAK